MHHNAEILHKLIAHTENIVKKSCLPHFISSDEYQYGDSFGERLYNEMLRIFNEGYEKIIVVGNDSPGINSETLIEVSKELDNQNLILGPSTDGGVYLIGVHRKNLDKHLFINLAWLSDRVCKSFEQYSYSLELEIKYLSKLHDIDNENDLFDHLRNYPLDKLSLWINSVLASDVQRNTDLDISSNSFELIGFKQMRAPPSWAN